MQVGRSRVYIVGGGEGDLGKTPLPRGVALVCGTAGRDPEHGLGSGLSAEVTGTRQHGTSSSAAAKSTMGSRGSSSVSCTMVSFPCGSCDTTCPQATPLFIALRTKKASLLTQLRHYLPPFYCKHFAACTAVAPPAAAGTVKFGADRAAQGGPMGP